MNREQKISISLVLTRDQVRMLRSALSTTDYCPPVSWDFAKSRDLRTILDAAETQATIAQAHVHWRCATVHGPKGCPLGSGPVGYDQGRIYDGEWTG